MRITFWIAGLIWIFVSSCSNTDYVDAVPRKSRFVASFDAKEASGIKSQLVLKAVLHFKNWHNTGLDLSERFYGFESPQGYYGFCACVADEEQLAEQLVKLGSSVEDYRECRFAQVGEGWLAGFNDRSFLLMGPVTLERMGSLKHTMAKYLAQKEEEGIRASRLYARLDSIQAPIAWVGRLSSLPAKIAMPLSLGMPRDAAPDDVLWAAGMRIDKHILHITGETYALNPALQQRLQQGKQCLRPIQGQWSGLLATPSNNCLFLNAEGPSLLALLRENKDFRTLLLGANMQVEMDDMLRSVDGDVAIMQHPGKEGHHDLCLLAQSSHNDSLCCYGIDREKGEAIMKHPATEKWMQQIIGARMAIVTTLPEMENTMGNGLPFLRQLLGHVRHIVIVMK